MKNLIKKAIFQMKEFIEPTSKLSAINLRQNQIVQLITKAQEEKAALHAIYGNKSFTGHISKYDPAKGKLVLKNMRSTVTTIIDISDIEKLTIVPSNITKAQKQP
ncbi:hypothetical protein [Streptococcus plurextorum]|uniref:hypothetical protein n=1 Tax=Streptococcus plurextorum TaxID=456876 RepID=UPI0004028F0F|nr:hypothetical protein [Streptococcus plurextorum]